MADSTLKIGTEAPKENRIGLKATDYSGGKSTLCAGCGHDAISNQIIRAFYEMSVKPENVAKFSGIGCSSKTPAYFLGRSHGFNAVHGRMPAVATGAALANHTMVGIGVSGDGDTASIGLGQFMHLVRRNIPLIYIIENNGVYGLTKGQFSATADEGSKLKTGVINDLHPMDLCALAVQLGCGYVARGFAGDPKQMINILKGALAHDGLSVIDVISPCTTFNNHEGSTKGYTYSKEHDAHHPQEARRRLRSIRRRASSAAIAQGDGSGSDADRSGLPAAREEELHPSAEHERAPALRTW